MLQQNYTLTNAGNQKFQKFQVLKIGHDQGLKTRSTEKEAGTNW